MSKRMTPLATTAPTLVLDLDGTLVDSLPDLTAALDRLMAARGLAGFTPDEVRPMVGDGTPRLIERAFAARAASPGKTDLATFVADYTAHAADASRPYPGVDETLAGLSAAGWRFAVCTNKPAGAARALFAALGLDHWFAAVGGGDSFAVRKPDPAHLLGTIALAGGDPRRAVMVGDHANDIAAANGAGLPAIFALWGYGPETMARGAAATARRFTELAVIAPRLLP
jgi:phosphoglycolate phosphatase